MTTSVPIFFFVPRYVALSLRTSSHGTFNSAYHLCQLTPLGNSLLADHAATVALAVPQMLRKEEQEAAQRRDALKTTLAAQGIDVGQIPEDELTHASGTSAAGLDPRAAPSIAWHQHLHRLRTAGLGDDAATWAALLQRVLDWRARKARELTLAPVAVLTDADAYRVAYQRATRPADLRDLVRVGAAVDDLAATMLRAVMELFPAPPPVVAAAADGGTQMFAVFSAAGHTPASSSSSGDAFITFPAAFVPVHWPLAKLPAKKEPVWQASARAFAAGQVRNWPAWKTSFCVIQAHQITPWAVPRAHRGGEQELQGRDHRGAPAGSAHARHRAGPAAPRGGGGGPAGRPRAAARGRGMGSHGGSRRRHPSRRGQHRVLS